MAEEARVFNRLREELLHRYRAMDFTTANDNIKAKPHLLLQGPLVKRGGFIKTWRRRNFQLISTGGNVRLWLYVDEKGRVKRTVVLRNGLNAVLLTGTECGGMIKWPKDVRNQWDRCLALVTARRTFYMYADTAAEARGWVEALRDALHTAHACPGQWLSAAVPAAIPITPTQLAPDLLAGQTRALERMLSEEQIGLFVLLDLRHLYTVDDWVALADSLWQELAAGRPPPWVLLVPEEELGVTQRFVMISHRWGRHNPINIRTGMRDWWCTQVAMEYFGGQQASWIAGSEPLWVWCDKLSNPQDKSRWSPLHYYTMDNFGTCSAKSSVFAVYEGYTLQSWRDSAADIDCIVSALGTRLSGCATWNATGLQPMLLAQLLALDGDTDSEGGDGVRHMPGLIRPNGEYDERVWCQVEVAARQNEFEKNVMVRPLLQSGLSLQGNDYLGALDFCDVIISLAITLMGLKQSDVEHQDNGSLIALCRRDFLHFCVPNLDLSGTVLGMITCSSIFDPADLDHIVPKHAERFVTRFQACQASPTCGTRTNVEMLVSSDGNCTVMSRQGILTHAREDVLSAEQVTVATRAVVRVARGADEWSAAAMRGAICLAWISALEQTRNLCWRHSEFVRALAIMMKALPRVSVRLQHELTQAEQTVRRKVSGAGETGVPSDSATGTVATPSILQALVEHLLASASLPSLLPTVYGLPAEVLRAPSIAKVIPEDALSTAAFVADQGVCTDVVRWGKVRLADQLGAPEMVNINDRLVCVLPFDRPEKMIGTVLVTDKHWSGMDKIDWSKLGIKLERADMANFLASQVVFTGLAECIVHDDEIEREGLQPIGVDLGQVW